MKDFLRLPSDPSGYGDFGVSYVGVDARVHFQYMLNGRAFLGEIHFEFCVHLAVNGILNHQEKLPYDTILVEHYENEEYEGFNRYVFMLSGSDFQFSVIAKGCNFVESLGSSSLIEN